MLILQPSICAFFWSTCRVPENTGGGGRTAKQTAAKGALKLEVFCVSLGLSNTLRIDRQAFSCHFGFSFAEKNKGQETGCWQGRIVLTISAARVESALVFES